MKLDPEDIIRMARVAGIEFQQNTGLTGRVRTTTCGSQAIEKIENLVKAAFAAGADAESKRIHAEGMVTIGHMREQIAAALAQERDNGQKWYDAVTAHHKQEILAEREACAKFCETNQVWVGKGKRGFSEWGEDDFVTGGIHKGMDYAAAIRARGQ